MKAFPQAKVVATEQVVKHIEETKAAKLAYWGPTDERRARAGLCSTGISRR